MKWLKKLFGWQDPYEPKRWKDKIDDATLEEARTLLYLRKQCVNTKFTVDDTIDHILSMRKFNAMTLDEFTAMFQKLETTPYDIDAMFGGSNDGC